MRKVYRALVLWSEENKQLEGLFYTKEDADRWAEETMKTWPNGRYALNVTYIDSFERDSTEEDAFIEAVLNKDGPNAHPDSMFAMKYSEKF